MSNRNRGQVLHMIIPKDQRRVSSIRAETSAHKWFIWGGWRRKKMEREGKERKEKEDEDAIVHKWVARLHQWMVRNHHRRYVKHASRHREHSVTNGANTQLVCKTIMASCTINGAKWMKWTRHTYTSQLADLELRISIWPPGLPAETNVLSLQWNDSFTFVCFP